MRRNWFFIAGFENGGRRLAEGRDETWKLGREEKDSPDETCTDNTQL